MRTVELTRDCRIGTTTCAKPSYTSSAMFGSTISVKAESAVCRKYASIHAFAALRVASSTCQIWNSEATAGSFRSNPGASYRRASSFHVGIA